MRLIDFKIINIIFRFTLFIVFLLLTSKKVFSETYLSQNLSMGCKFVFSNYFKNIIKIKENDAIFTINKNDPSILFANTDELDASIQITVRKINNPKSPTITLFMALEKGKREGNFIIPNLRQNLCNGKFEKYNQQQNDVKAERKSQKPAEEKAKRDAELEAEKLAEEKIRLEAQEKQKKLAEQLAREEIEKQEKLERERIILEQKKIRQAEQEKIKKKSEEVARKKRLKKEKEKKRKLVEEKAKREAEIRAQKLAEEKAKREAEIRAQKLAEEKAKREAEIRALKLAEEKAKREAEIRAQKLAEEKAKRDAELKAKQDAETLKLSEETFETMLSMKEIFEIGETYINDHVDFNKINKIKLNINDYLNKSFETFSPQEQKLFLDQYNEYVTLLFKFYNEKLQSGKIPTKNDFQDSLNNYILDQKNILKEYRLILNDKNIFDDFKQKFSKTDWPNNFSEIIKKIDEFNKSDYKLMIGSKTDDIWNKFIYPSNVHLKKIKGFKKEMKTWIEMGSDKFKNYYNEQKFRLNNKKNLDKIKKKQEDLSVFDNLGN